MSAIKYWLWLNAAASVPPRAKAALLEHYGSPEEMYFAPEGDYRKLLGDKIAQVHISDYRDGEDCLAPGTGCYDFGKLFSALNAAGYNESALIELYRQNYGEPAEIGTALSFLKANFG